MFKFNVIKAWWNPEAARRKLVEEHKAGIRALAEYVAERARIYCPVDSGELRASIQVVSEAGEMRHHVIVTARHAEPQEFGFTMRNGRFFPPRAYLRKAVRDGAAAMPRFVGDSRVRQGFRDARLMGVTFQ